MAKSKDDRYIIYPEYFNLDLQRKNGRRMPCSHSVNSPTSEDLFKVSKQLGLSPILEKGKSYPSRWFKSSGRIRVAKKQTKTKIMKMIGNALVRLKK
jgi:signal recognition particle subunit SRP19